MYVSYDFVKEVSIVIQALIYEKFTYGEEIGHDCTLTMICIHLLWYYYIHTFTILDTYTFRKY